MNIAFGFLYFGPLFAKIISLGYLSHLLGVESGEKTSPVWLLVFGGQNFSAYSMALAIAILVYQALRFRATLNIGPLIEEQKLSGKTPQRDDYKTDAIRQPYIAIFGFAVVAMFAYDLLVKLQT